MRSSKQNLQELRTRLLNEFGSEKIVMEAIYLESKNKPIKLEDYDKIKARILSKEARSRSLCQNQKESNMIISAKSKKAAIQNSQSRMENNRYGNNTNNNSHRKDNYNTIELPSITNPAAAYKDELSPSRQPYSMGNTSYQMKTVDTDTVSQSQMITRSRLSKQVDIWDKIVNEDVKRYNQEVQMLNQKRKSTKEDLKTFLEKQMEQKKSVQMMKERIEHEEGEDMGKRMNVLFQKEKEKNNIIKENLRKIKDENNYYIVEAEQLKQKEKQKAMISDQKNLEEALKKESSRRKQEMLEIQFKKKKIRQDLVNMKDQNEVKKRFEKSIEKDLLGNDVGFSTQTSELRLMRNSSLDPKLIYNPFVDKSGIQNHKRKIQELVARNERLYNIYEKSGGSPGSKILEQDYINTTTSLGQYEASDFQTKLDQIQHEKAKKVRAQKYETAKTNIQLVQQKSITRMEYEEMNKEKDKLAAQRDSELAEKLKQEEQEQEKLKKQAFLNNLNEFTKINKQIKKGDKVQGMSPQELALNKKRLRTLGIEEPEINFQLKGVIV